MGITLKRRKALFCWLNICMDISQLAESATNLSDLVNFSVPYITLTYTEIENLENNPQLDKLYQSSTFIVDMSRDGYNIRTIKEKFDSLGFADKAIYLTANFTDLSSSVIFFPYFFFRSNLRFKNNPRIPIKSRSGLVSCLNRNSNGHRLYLYYQLLQKPYINEIMLSMHGLTCPYSGHLRDLSTDLAYQYLPSDIKEKLKTINLNKEAFPGDSGHTPAIAGNPGDHSWQHPAYTDYYLNIITESGIGSPFFSEKTFKPLAAGQLFLMVNGFDSIDALRYLGFETFDTDFGNHVYDHMRGTFIDRIDQMLSLLDSKYSNIADIYHSNKQAIQYNQDYALSDQFREDLLKPLRKFGTIA